MSSFDLTDATFRKSSYSKADENCVEVARLPGIVAVRDSKNPDGAVLQLSSAVFEGFVRSLR